MHICVGVVCVRVCVCVCVCLLQGLEAERSVHLEYSIYLVKLVPPGGEQKIEKIQKHHKFRNTELALHWDEYIRKPDLKEPIFQTKISELKRL